MPQPQHTASPQSILARVNWRAVGARAAKELSNREVHAPVVSTYRWWARRPHSVMGALLDAAVAQYGPELVVSDPFSGGGTVTFEAARRGLKTYAQDLYPWPARGLAAALGACDTAELQAAADQVLAALAPHREAYRTAAGGELSHVLRVRRSTCAHCAGKVFEFPHGLVSVTSRSLNDRGAFFGCRACGHLTRRTRDVESFTCAGCDTRRSLSQEATGCPHCLQDDGLRPEDWQAVLVQELAVIQGQLRAVLRPVAVGDPVALQPRAAIHEALAAQIPTGRETKRLVDNGFAVWGDLYSSRQLEVLAEGLKTVALLDCAPAIKDRLAFSLLGAAEMPAFLSRWDRFNLKPFEGMANHRYTQTTFAAESNLLSPVGRGTIPRRLEAATQALQWFIDSRQCPPKVATTVPGRRGRKKTDWDVLVTTGSSVKQALQTGSVNVVVTDPPYFDDVQYGELARLFHVWLKVYDPSVVVDESAEAVPNSTRGTSTADYEATIAACLAESRRTLKANGRLILTFHNKKVVAWRALAGAIATAGLKVTALAAVLAENQGDHCKRSVNAMLHDLVIECAPASTPRLPALSLEFTPRSAAEKNLAAMGIAVAECVAAGSAADLGAGYRAQLERLGVRKRLID
jgi:putative DNA methylase